MSIKAMSYVWDNYKSGGSKKLIMLALADTCNDSGECYPGIPRIAEKSCLSERYTQTLLRELETDGEICIETNGGVDTGHGNTNRYYLLRYRQSIGIVRGEPYITPTNNGVNHTSPQGVNHTSPQGVNHTSPKPSVEPPRDPSTTVDANSLATPVMDEILETMKATVKKELKQYGQQCTNVAKVLLNRFTGEQSGKNLEGSPATPDEVIHFGIWWDSTKRKIDGTPLTRPKNEGSVKTWFEVFRLETTAQTVQQAIDHKMVQSEQRSVALHQAVKDSIAPVDLSQLKPEDAA